MGFILDLIRGAPASARACEATAESGGPVCQFRLFPGATMVVGNVLASLFIVQLLALLDQTVHSARCDPLHFEGNAAALFLFYTHLLLLLLLNICITQYDGIPTTC